MPTQRPPTPQQPTSSLPTSGPRSQPKSQPKSRRRHRPVFRFWVWELIFLVVAVGCLVAILVIINRENGKPVEQWRFSITLNSLVALLSTILRGIMVAIAAEIIAQEKWAWLWSSSPSSRPLRTLHAFDQGSRGIWSALLLIPTAARWSPPALLSITVIVLSFAIGPFVQQSITTVGRDFTAAGLQDDAMFNMQPLPSLPISHSINEQAENTFFQLDAGTWLLHPKIRADTINALSPLAPTNQSSPAPPLPLKLTLIPLPPSPSPDILPPTLQSAPPQCVYPVTCFVARIHSQFYTTMFNTNCSYDTWQAHVLNCQDNWWLTPLWKAGDASFATLSNQFDNFARKVTNSFRTGTARGPGSQEKVLGMAHRTLPVTVVDWRWLLLPIGLLGIEVVVLGWVVLRGWWNRERRGEMVWKSSVLPFMFYRDLLVGDLDAGDGGGCGLMTTAEMKKAAGGVGVRAFGRTEATR